MKTYWPIITISVSLIIFLNRIQAQNINNKLNQLELMKHFIGSWKADYAKDTVVFWDAKSYGTGLECNYRFFSKGEVVKEGKQLWGYDKKNDKYVASSLPKGMDLEIDAYWFTPCTLECSAGSLEGINKLVCNFS
jgi:hypothetical protein